MTLNYAVPVGKIKFVLYDDRKNSPTCGEVQEIFMGKDNYCLVTVPPNVWNGFKGIGTEMSLLQIVQASPMIRMKLVASTHRIITSPMTGL